MGRCPCPSRRSLSREPPSPYPSRQGFQYEDVNISIPLTSETFDHVAQHYDVLVVNFFAPWCPWCAVEGRDHRGAGAGRTGQRVEDHLPSAMGHFAALHCSTHVVSVPLPAAAHCLV